MFFEFLSSHPFVLLAIAVYLAVCFKTVRRFYREVGVRFSRPVKIVGLPLFFLVPPLLWYILKRRDRKAEEQRSAEACFRRRLAEELRRTTNVERARLRAAWIDCNGLVLYSHTIDGITAVMTPDAHFACAMQTQRARRDGHWQKANVLLPSSDVFLFVDKNGWSLFAGNHGTLDPIGNHWVSGWLSDLDRLVEHYRVEVIKHDDIFVPYVNESLVPFRHQTLNQHQRNYEHWLIVMQTPEEMHPLL